MEPMTRIELVNLFLTKEALYRLSYMGIIRQMIINPDSLSTTRGSLMAGAGDEARTRDIQLGRLKLYQLSYSRLTITHTTRFRIGCHVVTTAIKISYIYGGGGRI